MAFGGTVAIRAMKDGDFLATIYPGTTAGLQAAVAYIGSSGGKIMIGPGVITVTASTALQSNIWIEGCGPQTIFRRDSSALAVNIFNDGGSAISDVRITDIEFDNKLLAVTAQDLFFASGSQSFRIERCRWVNLTNRAADLVTFTGSAGSQSRFIKVNDNVVIGGTTTTTWNSFQVFNASDVELDDNVIDGWGAIKTENAFGTSLVMRRIKISRNTFHNVDQTNIFVRNGGSTEIEDVAIFGNVGSQANMTIFKGMIVAGESYSGSGTTRNVAITGNSGRGYIGHFISLGGVTGTLENSTVTGNSFDGRFEDVATLGSTSESSGINFAVTSRRVSIVANTIRYTGRSGIRGSGDHCIVSGNIIELAAQNDLAAPTPLLESAIYIFNPTADTIVSSNIIYNPSNSARLAVYSTSGITIDSAATVAGVEVYGNTIIDDRGGSVGMGSGIKLGVGGATTNPSEARVWGNKIKGWTVGAVSEFGTGSHVLYDNIGTSTMASDWDGSSIASAATITLPNFGRVFLITGVTNVTSVTAATKDKGRIAVLRFSGILTFTDGSNLILNGNLVTTTDDTITLYSDGTNWYELARSVN